MNREYPGRVEFSAVIAKRRPPKVREILWASLPTDHEPPEMSKTRPVLIVRASKFLSNGKATVLPLSTAEQRGPASKYAHPLSFAIRGTAQSYVICDHPMTLGFSRLTWEGRKPMRLDDEEFKKIMELAGRWQSPLVAANQNE